MKIGLIGDKVTDVAALPGALDGVGAVLAHRFEKLVASGAAVAAFGEMLMEYCRFGGQLIVALPPAPSAPPMGALPAIEIRRSSTYAAYLEALLGDIDALLCCPGGIATLHEFHHFLDAGLRAATPDRAIVYLYDRDKYFAPLRLQMQVLIEAGATPAELEQAIRPFESARGLRALLQG